MIVEYIVSMEFDGHMDESDVNYVKESIAYGLDSLIAEGDLTNGANSPEFKSYNVSCASTIEK